MSVLADTFGQNVRFILDETINESVITIAFFDAYVTKVDSGK